MSNEYDETKPFKTDETEKLLREQYAVIKELLYGFQCSKLMRYNIKKKYFLDEDAFTRFERGTETYETARPSLIRYFAQTFSLRFI